jgi:hypothetical protein
MVKLRMELAQRGSQRGRKCCSVLCANLSKDCDEILVKWERELVQSGLRTNDMVETTAEAYTQSDLQSSL